MLFYLQHLPYLGDYKKIKTNGNNSEPVDEYEVVALSKRLGITLEDMKQMSYVSLINILLSSVEETERPANQDDIDKMFG